MEYGVKLIVCSILTLALVISELAVGHFTHCLTLLAVTNQSLQNLITLSTSAISRRLSKCRGGRFTYGWFRLEVLGLFCGQIFLASLCFAIAVEALQTIFHSGHLDVTHNPAQVCLLGGIHFAVWLVIFFLLGGNTSHQASIISDDDTEYIEANAWYFIKNVRLCNIYRDLASCFSLITATAIIMAITIESAENSYVIYVDPIFALITISILLTNQGSFVKSICMIVLQSKPSRSDENVASIEKKLCESIPDLLGIHDYHHWILAPGKEVLTLHAVFKNQTDFATAFDDLKMHLKKSAYYRVTVQPEFANESSGLDNLSDCKYACMDPVCKEKKCCTMKIVDTRV